MRTLTLVAALAGVVAASAEENGLRRLSGGHAYATPPQAHSGGAASSVEVMPSGHSYRVPGPSGHAQPSNQGHAYGLPEPSSPSNTAASSTSSDDSAKVGDGAVIIWVLFGIFVGALLTFPLCYYLYSRIAGAASEPQAREVPVASPAAPEVSAPAEVEVPVEPQDAEPPLMAANEPKERERMVSDVSNQANYEDVVAMQV